MSSANQVLNTGQQAITNYDTSKIFIGRNDYKKAVYTNGTGASIDLVAGTVLGKITASGKLLPLKSDAVDGSQIPVGVLAHDITVANAATVNLTYCISGKVVQNKLIFLKAGDTVDTVVTGRTLGDRVAADSAGIILVVSTELSDFDNQ